MVEVLGSIRNPLFVVLIALADQVLPLRMTKINDDDDDDDDDAYYGEGF